MNPYLQQIQKGAHRARFSKRARVEILPLIDVMFLLVAFFMVTSISMVVQKGISVDLAPAETSNSTMEDVEVLTISVNKDGAFFLDKEPIELAALTSLLAVKAKENEDTPVVINADKSALHGRVVEALDLVRKSTLHNVIFAVEPKD